MNACLYVSASLAIGWYLTTLTVLAQTRPFGLVPRELCYQLFTIVGLSAAPLYARIRRPTVQPYSLSRKQYIVGSLAYLPMLAFAQFIHDAVRTHIVLDNVVLLLRIAMAVWWFEMIRSVRWSHHFGRACVRAVWLALSFRYGATFLGQQDSMHVAYLHARYYRNEGVSGCLGILSWFVARQAGELLIVLGNLTLLLLTVPFAVALWAVFGPIFFLRYVVVALARWLPLGFDVLCHIGGSVYLKVFTICVVLYNLAFNLDDISFLLRPLGIRLAAVARRVWALLLRWTERQPHAIFFVTSWAVFTFVLGNYPDLASTTTDACATLLTTHGDVVGTVMAPTRRDKTKGLWRLQTSAPRRLWSYGT